MLFFNWQLSTEPAERFVFQSTGSAEGFLQSIGQVEEFFESTRPLGRISESTGPVEGFICVLLVTYSWLILLC